MLTRTEICLLFPQGACFHQAPSILIYRQILRLIHRICCMQKSERCQECPLSSNCRYYWITGSHYKGYPGFLCPSSPFEKRKFKPKEELKIQLFWIGSCEELKSTADLALSEMKQTLMNQFFYLKSIRHERVQESLIKISSLTFITPVRLPQEFHSPLALTAEMNDWYQKWYQTEFCLKYDPENPAQGEWKSGPYIRMESTGLPTRKIAIEGHTGTLALSQPVVLSSGWKEIGLGKTNCIGGGKFETDHSI